MTGPFKAKIWLTKGNQPCLKLKSQVLSRGLKIIPDLVGRVPSFLLLISMVIVMGISILFLLTGLRCPLPDEFLAITLGAASAVFVFALLDILKIEKKDLESGLIEKKPTEILPLSEDLPESNWKRVKEDNLFASEVAWKKVTNQDPSDWGFEGAYLRVFEREKEKIGFSVLKFSDVEKAKKAFSGIYEELENRNTYPISVGENGIGIISKSDNFDATLFRVANILSLILMYNEVEISRRESARYSDSIQQLL